MKNTILHILKQSSVVALAVLLLSGAGYVFAQPTEAPGGSAGVPLPLHTGSESQTKQGDLTVTGSLTASGNLSVGGQLSVSEICLNGTCETTWPSGGSSIASGSQIALTPSWQGPANGGGAYNQCQSHTIYYSNGQTYNSFSYCGNNAPFSIQITAPGDIVSVTGQEFRCVYEWGNPNNPPSWFFGSNGTSSPFYTPAVITNSAISGNTITMTGQCPPNYNFYYLRPAVSVSYLYQE